MLTILFFLSASLSFTRQVCQAFHKYCGGTREEGSRQTQCSRQEEPAAVWHSPGARIKGLINLKYFPASEALD